MSVTAWRSRLKNAAAVKSSEVGMMLTFRAVTTQDLETVAPLIHRADPFGWTMQNLQSALCFRLDGDGGGSRGLDRRLRRRDAGH